MKKNLNLSEGFSAHVEIEDLENLVRRDYKRRNG